MIRTTTSRATSADWDERVEVWEEVAGSPAFAKIARDVCALARPSASDRVVDLGAGTGLLALSLASAVQEVTAVDISAAMLARLSDKAAEACLGNVSSVCADLRTLPLPDESATLVVSSYAFHHVNDAAKELALSEARRILVPGGRLVLCDMMFSLSLEPRDRALIAGKVRAIARRGPAGFVRIVRNAGRVAVGRWEKPASPESWRRMLAARGFSEIAITLLEQEAGIACARRPELSRQPQSDGTESWRT